MFAKTSRRFVLLVSCVLWISDNSASAQQLSNDDANRQAYETQIRPLLQNYCTSCHGDVEPEAKLTLEIEADTLDPTAQHEIWRKTLEKVATGEMPPNSEAQPSPAERSQLIDWLHAMENRIDCQQLSQPGRVTVRRLNRAEYNNTVRDLCGVEFRPADDFPADDVGNGFDNIADVLSLPPLLMEKYLDAAEAIADQVLANDEQAQRLFGETVTAELANLAAVTTADAELPNAITRFASRAFRRPASGADIGRVRRLYDARSACGAAPRAALSVPMRAVLASPKFLFRLETDPAAGEIRDLDGYELATRLSYFLWSSMGDEHLSSLAADNRWSDTTALEGEVQRMMANEKSVALLDNFVAQWLQLRSLTKLAPDPNRFPTFNESLREAMLTETRLFATFIIREDRSVLEFLDADYTFVNEQLAQHYGIGDVTGPEFRRVALTDPRRGGVLTQASILTLTSNPTRTSPVKRGKWIMENMLGTPPPPPPPGVQLLSEEGEAELLGSLRERMEQHRSNPACAVCHEKMDALGFGFENFDAIGGWREQDGRFAIDPSGSLPGNQQFRGPAELRTILRDQRREQYVRCLSEKMLTYALGRELQAYDRCAVDQIVRELTAADYRFSALVKAVVHSDPFRKRGFRGDTR